MHLFFPQLFIGIYLPPALQVKTLKHWVYVLVLLYLIWHVLNIFGVHGITDFTGKGLMAKPEYDLQSRKIRALQQPQVACFFLELRNWVIHLSVYRLHIQPQCDPPWSTCDLRSALTCQELHLAQHPCIVYLHSSAQACNYIISSFRIQTQIY